MKACNYLLTAHFHWLMLESQLAQTRSLLKSRDKAFLQLAKNEANEKSKMNSRKFLGIFVRVKLSLKTMFLFLLYLFLVWAKIQISKINISDSIKIHEFIGLRQCFATCVPRHKSVINFLKINKITLIKMLKNNKISLKCRKQKKVGKHWVT